MNWQKFTVVEKLSRNDHRMGLFETIDNGTLAMKHFAKSRWAARQYLDSQARTTLGNSSIYFMDVGVWAGGSNGQPKTTFGVVCENDILLCSWLNRVESGQWPGSDYTLSSGGMCVPLSGSTAEFLRKCNQEQRGFVVRATRASQPLTPPGQLILVIPDLHLHLYTGQPVERFRYRPTKNSPLVSLDSELRRLMDIGLDCKATVVQIGDLYEVWESEILLHMQYLEMLRMKARAQAQFSGIEIRSDHQTMISTGRVVPRNVMFSEDIYWVGNNSVLLDDQIQSEGIEFWNTDQICAGIRKAHKELFESPAFKSQNYYQIDGNHDNQLENSYWSNCAPEEYRTQSMLCHQTSRGSRHLDHVHREIGTGEHPIHIEHGLAYDWHNNDRDWWMEGHGFDVVYGFVAGVGSMIYGKRSDLQDYALETSDEWSELRDFEMRLACLRRADWIFGGNRQVKLVIMGHTHSPILVAWPFRTALFPTYPGNERYRNGKYWWKSDQELKEEEEQKKRKEEKEFQNALRQSQRRMPGEM